LSSESEYRDSGHVYYQTWAPKARAAPRAGRCTACPGDTLILAMKARDESTPPAVERTRRRAPRGGGRGPGHAPHHRHELRVRLRPRLHRHRADRDPQRRQPVLHLEHLHGVFRIQPLRLADRRDLLVYMDTRDGGADSTVDYNGSATKSGFDSGRDFKPDFCLVFETESSYTIKKWDSSSKLWVDTLTVPSAAYASLDSINNYTYAELRVPFTSIGSYDTTRTFRYLAVAQQENSNDPWNAFPVLNGLTKAARPRPSTVTTTRSTTACGAGWNRGASPASWPWRWRSSRAGAAGRRVPVLAHRQRDRQLPVADPSVHRARRRVRFRRSCSQPGKFTTRHAYSYLDNAVMPNTTYYYLLATRTGGRGDVARTGIGEHRRGRSRPAGAAAMPPQPGQRLNRHQV